MNRLVLVISMLLGLSAQTAQAHLRNFLDTYGYYTLEKGRYEMEFWTDLRDPDGPKESFIVHQTEFEYGITDRYTMGIYAVLIEGKGFSAIKLENRYRLSEPNEWPLDTALYLEIKDANGRKTEDEIEAKMIFSKNHGPWNFVGNPILEFEREVKADGTDEWEAEPAISVGAAYKAKGQITYGLELYSAEHKTRLVPGLYIDLAPDIRLNIGAGIGLEHHADDLQIKSILELEF